QVNIESGGFQTQDVLLFGEQSELVNSEIEANELAQIFSIAMPSDDTPLWIDNGFAAPLQGELSSPFGLDRTFNGFLRTRHTGWDINVGTGMPVYASASGEVVFARQLPIRGDYVLIHHGAGVYSGYAHFSVIHVTQGQTVVAGQLIGQVGTSGRSSSAHAHFEFIVDGEWVDPVDFIQMPLPG
ncbi:MAG: M23 family metallopeptidase, partial [Aggregatilineales bacterium]